MQMESAKTFFFFNSHFFGGHSGVLFPDFAFE